MADMGNLWIYDLWTVILGTIGMKTMWEGTDYWFIGHGNENPWISWGWLWMFVYLMDSSYYQLYNCWPSNKNWLNYMDGWFDFFPPTQGGPFYESCNKSWFGGGSWLVMVCLECFAVVFGSNPRIIICSICFLRQITWHVPPANGHHQDWYTFLKGTTYSHSLARFGSVSHCKA